jgi:hypothetical protein
MDKVILQIGIVVVVILVRRKVFLEVELVKLILNVLQQTLVK